MHAGVPHRLWQQHNTTLAHEPVAAPPGKASRRASTSCIVPHCLSHNGKTPVHRRQVLEAAAVSLTTWCLSGSLDAQAAGFKCPGLRGYNLQKCLREARQAQDAAEGGAGDVQAERLKYRQYEQPGDLVTLPSGIQYRELEQGNGQVAAVGCTCEMSYTVYRLSSGAYFKYSSGGTPVYMWSVGYGNEGKDDLGATYNFRLGDPDAVPRAVSSAMVGMKEGGRRRVLVPPELGWVTDRVGPPPPSFGASRRLAAHRDEALLFEVQLIKVRQPPGGSNSASSNSLVQDDLLQQGTPYKLPQPPSPFKNMLG
eukprot:jgi/Chrzof1/8300/Cz03g05120.t1